MYFQQYCLLLLHQTLRERDGSYMCIASVAPYVCPTRSRSPYTRVIPCSRSPVSSIMCRLGRKNLITQTPAECTTGERVPVGTSSSHSLETWVGEGEYGL